MPELKHLKIYSTQVSKAEVDRFRALAPNAVIDRDYDDVMRRELRAADRVLVQKSKRCGGSETAENWVRGASVKKLLDAVEVVPPSTAIRIGCGGDYTLTFYAQDRELGEARYYSSLNAMHFLGWPAVAKLTPASAASVNSWLHAHSIPH